MKTVLAVVALMAGAPLLEGFDVPVMPGLTEVPEARVTFDKEEGSIIETVLEGPVETGRVQTWYAGSLSGLGWVLESATAARQVYRRGADRLVIDYSSETGKGADGATRVRLLREPAESRSPESRSPESRSPESQP